MAHPSLQNTLTQVKLGEEKHLLNSKINIDSELHLSLSFDWAIRKHNDALV